MKLLIILTFIFTLCSCENKKSSDGRDHSAELPMPPATQENSQERPSPQKPQTPQGSTDTDKDPMAPPPVAQPTKPLPVIGFSRSQVTFNRKLEAQLELQLSKASDVPVVVEVHLVNGTALHYRDFSGFKTRSSETSQTIIFAPGTTRMKLPVIGGRHTQYCDDTFFYAKMDKASVQKAMINNDETIIRLRCY